MQLSVIIPVFNEADALPRLLADLQQQVGLELDLLVADGGSSDATARAVTAPARLVACERGRGRQMNCAAAAARFEHLLFLHADSRLSEPRQLANALQHLQQQWRASKSLAIAGHFALQFARSSDRHAAAFRYLEAKSASNRPQTINGDQGLLIHRDYFQQLGGFDEALPFMEDQAIAAAIFRSGRWLLLPGRLITSARRFELEGFHRRYRLMALMMAFYWTGCREFFSRARQVYPSQSEAKRLALWPFLRLIPKLLIDQGVRGALGQLYRLGRYGRQHFWQCFFFLDVQMSFSARGHHPFTRFHDRFLGRVLNNRFADSIAAIVIGLYYAVIIAPYYFVSDRILSR